MSTYSGAPDECSRHWPHKLVDGECDLCKAECEADEARVRNYAALWKRYANWWRRP